MPRSLQGQTDEDVEFCDDMLGKVGCCHSSLWCIFNQLYTMVTDGLSLNWQVSRSFAAVIRQLPTQLGLYLNRWKTQHATICRNNELPVAKKEQRKPVVEHAWISLSSWQCHEQRREHLSVNLNCWRHWHLRLLFGRRLRQWGCAQAGFQPSENLWGKNTCYWSMLVQGAACPWHCRRWYGSIQRPVSHKVHRSSSHL